MRRLLSSLAFVLFLLVVGRQLSGCAASSVAESGGEGADRALVLVSIDGFRWDYLDRNVEAPTLRWVAEGVRGQRAIRGTNLVLELVVANGPQLGIPDWVWRRRALRP